MRRYTLQIACLTIFSCAALANAQQNTTLQLPTFNFTTASTTVSVPDGGTGLLGGISRASEGSVTRGVPFLNKIPFGGRLFNNRGIGRDVGLSNMTVTPRIIILEEEELRQTGITADTLSDWDYGTAGASQIGAFGGMAAPVPAINPEIASKASFLTRHVARHDALDDAPPASDLPLPSLEAVRLQNQQAQSQRAAEADGFYARGLRAESEGKPGVAKIYYQMALRRASAELQAELQTRIAAIEGIGQDSPAQLADR